MSSKGKITDIIDLKSVENQKKALLSMLNEIYSSMGKISDNMISLGIDFKGAEKLSEVIKLKEKQATVEKELQKQLAETAQLQVKIDSMRNGEAKRLADVNVQLQKRKQELRDNAKLESAAEGSIEKMRLQLSKLKKEWAAEADEMKRATKGNEIKELNSKILEAEKSIGVFGRQVGNYEIVSNGLRGELKLLTQQLAEMKLAGLDGTEAYDQLVKKAGEMSDAMSDAAADIKKFASDTGKLDQVVSAFEGLTGVFATLEGTMAIVGVENEELQKTFVKLQAAMAVLNGLKAIQNTLQKESAAYTLAENLQKKLGVALTWAQNKAETGGIITRKLATAAQWALNAAMKANPAGLLIAALTILVSVGYTVFRLFKSGTDTTKQYNSAIDQSKQSVENLNRELDRNVKMMEAQGESQRAIITEKLKAANEEFKIQNDLVNKLKSLGGKLTDDQKEQLKEAEQAEKDAWKKIVDLHDESSALQIKQQRDLQKTRLENMKDGSNKEISTIRADYDEKIKQAEGNKELQTELEKQAQTKISDVRRKYAMDYLKENSDISKKLNESRIALMVDGFDKELALLRQNYKSQIDEIDNKLKTETELTVKQAEMLRQTKSNILKKQAEDEEKLIAENELKALQNQEKIIQLQMEGEEAGSTELITLKQRLIETQRQIELSEAEKTGLDKAAINAKYNKLIADEALASSIATLDKQSQSDLLAIDRSKQAELQVIRDNLASGLISLQDYEKQAADIEKKYSDQSIQLAIDEAKKKLEILKNAGADTDEAERNLFNLEKQLSDSKTANFIENEGKKAATHKEVNAKLQELGQAFYDSAISMANSFYDAKIMRMDEEAKKDEENKAKELELAGGNEELKNNIEAKYAAKAKQRDAERRRLEIEKAKFNKMAGIFQVGIDTAVAIMKATAEQKYWMIPIIGALGALQLATIAAQPLPKYFKGRDDGPAEFAWVGERGQEAIRLASGETFLTPDRPTVTFLPKHAEVIPHQDLMNRIGMFSFSDRLPQAPNKTGDLDDLKLEIRSLKTDFNRVVYAIKTKREYHFNFDENGFSTAVRDGQNFTRYINRNVKL